MLTKLLDYFKYIHLVHKSKIDIAWFKIVQGMMEFAVDVQQRGKPMLTKIATVDMSKTKEIGDSDIVCIWAGVGDANPIERISHIKAQNTELKRLLEMCYNRIERNGNEDLLVNVSLVLNTFE